MVKIFLQYKDKNKYGNEKIVEGFFELIEEKEYYIKIRSGKNIVSIPWHNIEKMKEISVEVEVED